MPGRIEAETTSASHPQPEVRTCDGHPHGRATIPLDIDRLRTQLFDAVPVILTIADRDLYLRAANRTWGEATGLSQHEAIGAYIPDWYPGFLRPHWEILRRVLTTGEPAIDRDLVAPHPRDPTTPRIWRFSCYPLHDDDGKVIAVGVAAVDVTDERQAQAERDRIWERMRLLSRASGLLGTSLDFTATVRQMVQLVVPEYADVCGLLLSDQPIPLGARPDPLVLRGVTWAHAPAEPRPERTGPLDAPVDLTGTWLARVVTDREPVLVDLEDPAAVAGLPDLARLSRDLELRSMIAVPLLSGVDCLGCVVTGVTEARPLLDDDIQTAMELAGRLAAAVANARAYAQQRDTARTLQRALLPRELPAVPNLDVQWRTRPSTGEVGGDWFDLLPLPAGRAALVIGDAMGHGLNAAVVMGQLRTATRTLALLDLPPAQVLATINAVTCGLGTLATLIYAIFDPDAGTLTMANGGHLPPALRRRDGTVALLGDADDVLLGAAEEVAFTDVCHPFPPGSTLLLYTDGVVESPTVDITEGTRRLLDAFAACDDDLLSAAERVLAVLRPGDSQDDATVLLARAQLAPGDAT